jgi:capping protein beta
MPSEALRKLEIDANHAFDQYRDMYFEGGVSSVYLWDLDHGFAGALYSKTSLQGTEKLTCTY